MKMPTTLPLGYATMARALEREIAALITLANEATDRVTQRSYCARVAAAREELTRVRNGQL